MTVVVAQSGALPVYYLPWNPTAQQVVESDTTYLMDLNAEEQMSVATGRMVGANEPYPPHTDTPYWVGGTQMARAAGRYRDGLQSVTQPNGFMYLPAGGLWAGDQGTIEFFVNSSVAWSALSGEMAFRLRATYGNFITVTLNSNQVSVNYQQTQVVPGINKTLNAAATVGSGVWKSIALTMTGGVVTLYLDGVSAGSVTGCTPAYSWRDGGMPFSPGLEVAVDSPHLTVSDLRVSRLARVPGVKPA